LGEHARLQAELAESFIAIASSNVSNGSSRHRAEGLLGIERRVARHALEHGRR
jgi:hypothetical protein